MLSRIEGPADMIEDDCEPAGPCTDAARARLVMAYEACELADLARTCVPIGVEELCPDGTARSPGEVLADAARVVETAQRFFEAAVVFERVGGAGWEVVGEALGVPAHTARGRFAAAEEAFRELLSREWAGAVREPTGLRGCMTGEPWEVALDLDDWVLRHQDGDGDLGTKPVSGGLVRRQP
jgi:hypothetical protein